MKKHILAILGMVILVACSNNHIKPAVDMASRKLQMFEADRSFSKMSELKGFRAAFLEYIDSGGVLLRPNSLPIVGGEAIYYLSQRTDTSFVLTWDPRGGNVAESGEMGFTYGIYSIKQKVNDKILYGTYVSVWKLQADGKWKFVLDTGNEGIGEPE
jgi:ketosteroid isomerase-like protein